MKSAKNTLLILAGGLGTRLKNSEKRPKPLVEVNNKSFLTLLIQEYSKHHFFDLFIVLICEQKDLFMSWRKEEVGDYNVEIHFEVNRSGRTGAILNFLDSLGSQNESYYYVANGDTLLPSLNIKYLKEAEKKVLKDKPVIFCSDPDSNRDDYFLTHLKGNGSKSLLNTGLFMASNIWIESLRNNAHLDLDQHLFSEDIDPKRIVEIPPPVIDIGVPERLNRLRSQLK